MRVKKINPSWQPAENPGLAVGDILEITDPKALILNGYVVGVGPNDEELSPYDLYGKITKDEFAEFKAWRELEQAKSMKARLEKENKELEKAVGEKEEAKEKASTSEVVTKDMPWAKLQAKGKELGIFKVGMTKDELIKAINDFK